MNISLIALVIFTVVLLLFVVLFFVYGITALRIAKERRNAPETKFSPLENSFLDPKRLSRLVWQFKESENQILWADRQHYMAYLPFIFFLALVSTLVLAVGIIGSHFVQTLSVTIPSYEGPKGATPERHIDLGFLPTVIVVISGLVVLYLAYLGWKHWLVWRSIFRLVTNENLTPYTQPWACAFWLWKTEDYDPLPLNMITSVSTRDTFFGKIFGYGTLTVKTWNQEDEDQEYHEIRFVRKHKELKKALGMLHGEDAPPFMASNSKVGSSS